MSKDPNPTALDYTPAPDEVYRAGYVTACDNATDLDDARMLYEALYQEHGKPTTREPRQKRTRRTTEAERRDMYEQWKAGQHDYSVIARQYGLARVTVYTHIKNQATPQELEQITRQPASCGTRYGARRHRRNGEEACDPCKRAEADEAYERYTPKRARLGRRSS